MNAALYINKKEIDIIEVFDEYIIVQELLSKAIYTLYYWEIDDLSCVPKDGKIVDISNVISFAWHKERKNG